MKMNVTRSRRRIVEDSGCSRAQKRAWELAVGGGRSCNNRAGDVASSAHARLPFCTQLGFGAVDRHRPPRLQRTFNLTSVVAKSSLFIFREAQCHPSILFLIFDTVSPRFLPLAADQHIRTVG